MNLFHGVSGFVAIGTGPFFATNLILSNFATEVEDFCQHFVYMNQLSPKKFISIISFLKTVVI